MLLLLEVLAYGLLLSFYFKTRMNKSKGFKNSYFIQPLSEKGQAEDELFNLNEDVIIIGRFRGCSLVIPSDDVSNIHAVLTKIDDTFAITDYHSTNGVYLNKFKLIPNKTYKLTPGDILTFGQINSKSYVFDKIQMSNDNNNSEIEDMVPVENAFQMVHLNQIEALKAEIETVKMELASEKVVKIAKTEILETLSKEKDEVISVLTERNEKLEKELKAKLISLKTEMTRANKLENHKIDTIELNENLRKELSKAMEKIEVIEEGVREMDRVRSQLLYDNREMNHKISADKVTIAKLSLENTKLKTEVSNLKAKGETVREVLDQKVKKLESLESQNKDKNKKIADLEKKLAKSYNEAQFKELQDKNIKLQLEYEILEKKLAKSYNEAQFKELQDKYTKLQSEYEILVKKNKDLSITNTNLEEDLVTLSEKIDEMSAILEVEKSIQNNGQNQVLKDMQSHISEIMETELNCSICSEFFIEATILGCSHTFCDHCITSWKNKNKKDCPLCRMEIKSQVKSPAIDQFITKIVDYLAIDVKDQREQVLAARNNLKPKTQVAAEKQVPTQSNDWEQVFNLPLRRAGQPQRNAAQPQRNAAQPQRNAAQPQRNAVQPQHNAAQAQRNATPTQRDATQTQRNAGRDLFDPPQLRTGPFQAQRQRVASQDIRDEFLGIRDEFRGIRDEFRGIRDEGRGIRVASQDIRNEGRAIRDQGRAIRDEGRAIRDAGRAIRDASRAQRDADQVHRNVASYGHCATFRPRQYFATQPQQSGQTQQSRAQANRVSINRDDFLDLARPSAMHDHEWARQDSDHGMDTLDFY